MNKLSLDQHISRQFNDDLERVRTKVLEMGGLVEQQINDAISAMLSGDRSLAKSIRDTERTINEMELDIDAECATIFARRQPAASDLRMLLASIKSITDIERMGDEAKHIARFAKKFAKEGPMENAHELAKEISDRVRRMTRSTFDAFARFDVDMALSVLTEDKEVDHDYRAAMRDLLAEMADNPDGIRQEINMLWMIRSLERIGDHCVNICEYVIYMVQGEDVRHVKLDEVAERTNPESSGGD